MLLTQILNYLGKRGIPYSVATLIDTEITRISIPPESDSASILFFNRDAPQALPFPYGACFVRANAPFEICALRNVVTVENPRLAIILVANLFKPYFSQTASSLSPRAVIHPEARLGKKVIIMDGAVLGKCTIGDYTIIRPNAVIYDDVEIGSFCHIGANATLGAEGMGSEKYHGNIIRFPHFSGIEIKDNVFIGPNATIARGVLTPTVIESGCMIDARVGIGHNAHIDQNVQVIGGTIVCGSVTVGKNCFLGAGCILRDNITLAANIQVGMGAVVTKSFHDPCFTLAGIPARAIG